MARHTHAMRFEAIDEVGSWFSCVACAAQVGILPRVDGNKLHLGLGVINPGNGGFSQHELAELADWWLTQFHTFVACERKREVVRRRHRRAKRPVPRLPRPGRVGSCPGWLYEGNSVTRN